MDSEFLSVTIGECCDITTGFPFKSACYIDTPEGIRLVRGDNIVQGSLRWDGVKRWDPEDLDETLEAKYSLKENDVVLAMDRPWIEAGLKYSSIGRYDLPSLLVQRVARLRAKSGVEQRLLKYIIGSKAFTNHVLSIQTGTAVPHISSKQIAEYSFSLPPRSDQETIANILGTLDEKIELNRKTNETLEGIAKALFKSWFVDFDPVRAKAEGRPTGLPDEISDLFPDSFEESELGEIPSGWRLGPLTQILQVDPKRSLSKGSVSPYLEMKAVPTSGHSADGVYCREFTSGTKFKSGDTLLARITPCLENGKTAMVDFLEEGQIGWGSTEFIVLCGIRAEHNSFAYYLSRSSEFREHAIRNMVGSSGRQRVPSDSLADFHLPVAPTLILNAFSSLADSLLRWISHASKENSILSELRDALLPRLISGELRVPDAEKMLEEVGI